LPTLLLIAFDKLIQCQMRYHFRRVVAHHLVVITLIMLAVEPSFVAMPGVSAILTMHVRLLFQADSSLYIGQATIG
jgi:hypothetical protein